MRNIANAMLRAKELFQAAVKCGFSDASLYYAHRLYAEPILDKHADEISPEDHRLLLTIVAEHEMSRRCLAHSKLNFIRNRVTHADSTRGSWHRSRRIKVLNRAKAHAWRLLDDKDCWLTDQEHEYLCGVLRMSYPNTNWATNITLNPPS